ncbi:hypothetical protein C8F01DRAFT_1252527 [Mycena amicta]|nr:hypothetical protein C8F01DRAFT_1252527 [Mycena amicta]
MKLVHGRIGASINTHPALVAVHNTAKRADHKKILPHGVPSHIAASPQDYGVLDFKIPVEKETIEQLVPPDFAVLAQEFYFKREEPAVGHGTAWDVYLALLDDFEHLDVGVDVPLTKDWGYALTMAGEGYQDVVDLIPNLQALPAPTGKYPYLGGVNRGQGIDASQSRELDAMMNKDYPLPEGFTDINIEEEEAVRVLFSDDEDAEDSGIG